MVIDGIYYAVACGAAGLLVTYLVGAAWAFPLYLFGLFFLYFFRDPERSIPDGPVVVSPADGKVLAVVPENGLTRVSIFMTVFSVHVNRAPIGGVVREFYHKNGRFLAAQKEEASSRNEHTYIVIQDGQTQVAFKQIAGLIARRIVFHKKVGDRVERGERVGLIKFGSRADVLLGPEWDIGVRRGQWVKAGSSILARRKA